MCASKIPVPSKRIHIPYRSTGRPGHRIVNVHVSTADVQSHIDWALVMQLPHVAHLFSFFVVEHLTEVRYCCAVRARGDLRNQVPEHRRYKGAGGSMTWHPSADMWQVNIMMGEVLPHYEAEVALASFMEGLNPESIQVCTRCSVRLTPIFHTCRLQ